MQDLSSLVEIIKMKILDNTKSLSTLVADNSNGLGQIQPLSCVVTEELNGIYELDFTVNVNDKHYNDLKNSGLVKVTVGDGSEQIFRVFKVDEPIAMVSSFHAQHITYDLSKVVVKPFTATGAVNIKNQLVANMLGSYPFSTWTDITNTTSTFTNDIPRYFRECLGGYEGSVLDVLRPEYEWDNLTVKLHARRGADNGVRISYGKNLIDYSQEQNNENVYDGVYGYAVVDEVTYKADSYFNKTGATYPRILNVDFSSDYESGQVPTSAELLQKATTYAQNNSIEVPSINIKIDFIPLWQTEEYKNILPLERVSLGDTVHVYFDKLNVEASSRVIKTEWNVLTNKYDSIELGDAKANLNTIINDSVSTAVDDAVSQLDIDTSYIESKLDNITSLIANGLGLRVSTDSQNRIILHNEETIANSQYQYMITSQGFMMSNDYGQTWNSGWTTSGDAVVNSLATIVLNALEIHGSTITGTIINFGDLTDKYITAQPFTDGITFDGTGTIRMQPQNEFNLRNIDENGDAYNTMLVKHQSNQNKFVLENYVYNDPTRLANYEQFISNSVNNVLSLLNYNKDLSTQTLANVFTIGSYTNRATVSITNNNYTGNIPANTFVMKSDTDSNMAQLKNFNTDGTDRNTITLNSTSALSSVMLYNYEYNGTNQANYISLLSRSTGNSINIMNYYSNALLNSIVLNSDSTLTLWSKSDLRLRSNGAVRLEANYGGGSTQDIHMTGYTLHFYYTDKLSFHKGSSRYNVSFNSDGSVTWS